MSLLPRPVVVYIATSLDMFIARRNGAIDFLFTEGDYGYERFMDTVDTVVLGRKTYETCLGFEPWPYAGKKCAVFSQTLTPGADPRIEVVKTEPGAWIREERKRAGTTIYLVGGGALVHDFLISGAVDRFVLSIHPILLGEGLPLFFPRQGDTRLTCVACEHFPTGLVQITYDVARPE